MQPKCHSTLPRHQGRGKATSPMHGRSHSTVSLASQLTLPKEGYAGIPLADRLSVMLSPNEVGPCCHCSMLLERLSTLDLACVPSPPTPDIRPEPAEPLAPSPTALLNCVPIVAFQWSAPDCNMNALHLQPGWQRATPDDQGFQHRTSLPIHMGPEVLWYLLIPFEEDIHTVVPHLAGESS